MTAPSSTADAHHPASPVKSVRHEAAVAQLCSLFPVFDRAVIEWVLEDNDRKLAPTFQALAAMQQQQQQSVLSDTTNLPAAASAPAEPPSADAAVDSVSEELSAATLEQLKARQKQMRAAIHATALDGKFGLTKSQRSFTTRWPALAGHSDYYQVLQRPTTAEEIVAASGGVKTFKKYVKQQQAAGNNNTVSATIPRSAPGSRTNSAPSSPRNAAASSSHSQSQSQQNSPRKDKHKKKHSKHLSRRHSSGMELSSQEAAATASSNYLYPTPQPPARPQPQMDQTQTQAQSSSVAHSTTIGSDFSALQSAPADVAPTAASMSWS